MKRFSIHNVSMSKKLIAIYLLVVSIPVLIMGFYFPVQLNKEVEQNTVASYRYTAERISSEMLATLQEYLEIPLSLTYDKELTAFLNKTYQNDFEQYESISDVLLPVYEKIQSRNAALRMKIVHQNKSLDMSGLLTYDQSIEKPGGFSFTIEFIGRTGYLTANIPILDAGDTKVPAGIMKIYIPLYLLQNVMTSHGSVDHPVFLYDEGGRLIVGTHEEEIRGSSDYVEVEYNIRNSKLKIGDWKLVYLAPSNQLEEKLKKIVFQTIRLAGISVFAATVIILCFMRSFKKRINVLIECMKRLRMGDTRVQIPEVSRDEIGQLNEGFNVMVKKLDRLISDNYRSRIELQNAELEKQKLRNEQMRANFLALQRQINPHYLFNTLESIRMKILMNGDRETARIMEEFASGYREMMYTSTEMITIGEELNLVEHFFSVIRFRFGGHIRLNIFLEKEELKSCNIFKFTIQPLVENAIYHGVERLKEDGEINIRIGTLENNLLIEVEDNGVGMSREKINEILESIRHPKEEDNRNLALRNIYARLALIYKQDFRFEIDSEVGHNTKIRLVIPLYM